MKNHGDRPTIVVESNADAVPVIDQVDILRFRIGYPCPNCARPQVRYIDQLGQVQMCVGCGNPHELPNAILVTAPGPLFPVALLEPATSAKVIPFGGVDPNFRPGSNPENPQEPEAEPVEPVAWIHPSYLGPNMQNWAFEASRHRLSPSQVPLYTDPPKPSLDGFKLDEITPACLEYAQAARKAWGCTENDGFAIEMAYQFGATVIDDDCELLAITRENMVNLMAALGFEHREPSGLRCAACPPDHEPAAVLDGPVSDPQADSPVSDPQVAGCSCAACTARFGNWLKGD